MNKILRSLNYKANKMLKVKKNTYYYYIELPPKG